MLTGTLIVVKYLSDDFTLVVFTSPRQEEINYSEEPSCESPETETYFHWKANFIFHEKSFKPHSNLLSFTLLVNARRRLLALEKRS